jgi:hypothetical protein
MIAPLPEVGSPGSVERRGTAAVIGAENNAAPDRTVRPGQPPSRLRARPSPVVIGIAL